MTHIFMAHERSEQGFDSNEFVARLDGLGKDECVREVLNELYRHAYQAQEIMDSLACLFPQPADKERHVALLNEVVRKLAGAAQTRRVEDDAFHGVIESMQGAFTEATGGSMGKR